MELLERFPHNKLIIKPVNSNRCLHEYYVRMMMLMSMSKIGFFMFFQITVISNTKTSLHKNLCYGI